MFKPDDVVECVERTPLGLGWLEVGDRRVVRAVSASGMFVAFVGEDVWHLAARFKRVRRAGAGERTVEAA